MTIVEYYKDGKLEKVGFDTDYEVELTREIYKRAGTGWILNNPKKPLAKKRDKLLMETDKTVKYKIRPSIMKRIRGKSFSEAKEILEKL